MAQRWQFLACSNAFPTASKVCVPTPHTPLATSGGLALPLEGSHLPLRAKYQTNRVRVCGEAIGLSTKSLRSGSEQVIGRSN
jgi:hypothetical protein